MFITYLSRAISPISYHFKRHSFVVASILETNGALAPEALGSSSDLEVVAFKALAIERFVEGEVGATHCENRRSAHTGEFLLPAMRYNFSVTLTYWVALDGCDSEVVSGRRKRVLFDL